MQTRSLPALFMAAALLAACSDRPADVVSPQHTAVSKESVDSDVPVSHNADELGGSVQFNQESDVSSNMIDDGLDMNNIQFEETLVRTDFAVGGLGRMRDFGRGTITMSGISGKVTKATLYWHGPTTTTDPLAGANVFVNGTPVRGRNIGFSSDNCWGYSNSQAWAADVTALVAAQKNGAYNLSGFGAGRPVNSNGASLIVFYDDGNAANNRDAVVFEGNDSNINNSYDAPGWNVTLAGINYTSGTANMQLHVADGQAWQDDAVRVNGVTIAGAGAVFQGSVPGSGPDRNGSLWDIRSFNVTSLLTPGSNTLSLRTGVYSDCLALVVAIVDLPAGAAPPPANTPPTLSLSGPYTGVEGNVVAFNFSGSDAQGDAITYTWNFGDGTGGSGTTLPTGHVYADDRATAYDVSVTATDAKGAQTTGTVKVSIANVSPTISLGADATIYYTDTHTFNGQMADPGADAWSYSVDWGNGTTTGSFAASGPISLSRMFALPGTYTVRITVQDGDGGVGSDEAVVTVLNRAPVANAGADQKLECTLGGAQVTLDGSASFDPDPTGRIVDYSWSPAGSGVSPTISLPLGTHNVTLQVTDDFGAKGTDAVVIGVVDTQAPTVGVAAPMKLWPPNHKYTAVNLGFTASDACASSSSLTAVATIVSNEADDANGTGDGNTTGDIKVTRQNGDVVLSSNTSPTVTFNPATDRVEVRVERYGTLAPRVYTIAVVVNDPSGNTRNATTQVVIDHNR